MKRILFSVVSSQSKIAKWHSVLQRFGSMKKVFKIDCGLYPFGLITAISGFGLHISGHGGNHHTWEIWAVAHTLVATAFLYLIICHCMTHKAWFKSLKQTTVRRKRRPTIILSLMTAATCISGLALLAIMGANTSTGLMHYKLGIVFSIFLITHSTRRFRILWNTVKR